MEDNNMWFALILLCAIIIFGLACWAIDEHKRQKARHKRAAEPIDSTGSIREKGHELRQITYRGKRL